MQILGQPQLQKGATGQEGGEKGENIQKQNKGKGWSRRYACFGISVLGLEMRFDKMGLA